MNINITNSYKPAFKANQMPPQEAKYLDNKIKSANTVDLFCHKSADEDAFNSQKVLYDYLSAIGKNPRIITTDEPYNYGFDRAKYNMLCIPEVDENTQKADLAVCVDFSKKERLNDNVLKYLESYDNNDVIGFDHHNENQYVIPSTMHISRQYKSIADMPVEEPKNYYVDSSARSCSSILYRFLNAVGFPISKDQMKSIYCGMSDDMNKSNYLNFNDDFSVQKTQKFDDDDNTNEVYTKVSSGLSDEDKLSIVKHLNIMAALNNEEKAFQKRLFNNIKTSSNGEFAYVELSPKDSQWIALGGDNKRTSSILRDFRIRTLANNADDKMLSPEIQKKLQNVKAVAVFYSKPDCNTYKMSIHTKDGYAKKYFEYVRENLYPELVGGGHDNRAGGNISTLDEDKCHEWTNYFKTASENV